MNWETTAVILIGYQKDYFAHDGILRGVIEEADRNNHILQNTLRLLEQLKDTNATIIQTPIIFTKDYGELVNPVGILKAIKEVQAFQEGASGADIIPELEVYGDRIITVAGKRGLNAFSNTQLDQVLRSNKIESVLLAGAVTSICIDSTGRAAHEKDYQVSILSDCTASRTIMEQDFYCEHIFPLYANVLSSSSLFS